jgi:hypothetical protein
MTLNDKKVTARGRDPDDYMEYCLFILPLWEDFFFGKACSKYSPHCVDISSRFLSVQVCEVPFYLGKLGGIREVRLSLFYRSDFDSAFFNPSVPLFQCCVQRGKNPHP